MMVVMEPVTFYSDGLKLVGDLYLPEGAQAGEVPAVVFCAGWTGSKYSRSATFAQPFLDRGCALLSFEYRGWGDSEGDITRLFLDEHTADARAAVAYLRQRPEIDGSQIAMMGMLNGAGVALQAATEDEKIGAVACFYPFGDGARWMRSLRRHWEWLEFQERIEHDRATRAVTGVSEVVDPNEIVIRDPHILERNLKNREKNAALAAWQISLASADAILTFRPEDHFHRLGQRPVFCVGVESDTMMPLYEVTNVYDQVPGPKELVVLSGIAHHDIYNPEYLDPVLDKLSTFIVDGMAANT
jgi:hypothetical protein